MRSKPAINIVAMTFGDRFPAGETCEKVSVTVNMISPLRLRAPLFPGAA